MFPAGQFLLGLQLEGRDGWDQGTTGTDRYIGSFGGTQPAGPGADRDRSVVKHLWTAILGCSYEIRQKWQKQRQNNTKNRI